jgi:hypothetical protein
MMTNNQIRSEKSANKILSSSSRNSNAAEKALSVLPSNLYKTYQSYNELSSNTSQEEKASKLALCPLQSNSMIQIMLCLSWLSETCAHVRDVLTNPPARSSSRLSTSRQKLP